MSADPTSSKLSNRIASLDQFRGYTVAGMLFVNFVSGYAAIPAIFKHHNTYCSYADTIMPQFFFAVGFAFRLTYLKRAKRDGRAAAIRHAVGRNLGLLLLGLVFHSLDGKAASWNELTELGVIGVLSRAFRRGPFQTLTHIALASLWCLPVIGARARIRWAYLGLSAAIHLGLSYFWYFDLAWTRPVIDGGPLGFLTWSIPIMVGSFAADLAPLGRPGSTLMAMIAAATMLVGYVLSNAGGYAPPPFVAPDRKIDMWMMSQRTGSASYQLFAAGFSMAVYLFFRWLADRRGLTLAVFTWLSRNALAAYLVHGMVFSAIKPYTPKDAPLWYVLAAFATAFGVIVLFMRHLDRDGTYLKL